METPPMFMNLNINIVKMALVPKMTYTFNATPAKIIIARFAEMEKPIIKFT